MKNRNGSGSGTRKQLASVSSLVEFRSKLQGTLGHALKVIGAPLRDDAGPLGDGGAADIQDTSNRGSVFKMTENVLFEHEPMLTIVSERTQPCVAPEKLTSVYMKAEPVEKDWKKCLTLGQRLRWSMDKAMVTTSEMATHCKTSRVSVGKWLQDGVSDMRLDNFFCAAQLCVVNERWLGTGEGAPDRGIGNLYAEISGPDLAIARRLTAINDKGIRDVIRALLDSKQPNSTKSKPATKRTNSK